MCAYVQVFVCVCRCACVRLCVLLLLVVVVVVVLVVSVFCWTKRLGSNSDGEQLFLVFLTLYVSARACVYVCVHAYVCVCVGGVECVCICVSVYLIGILVFFSEKRGA